MGEKQAPSQEPGQTSSRAGVASGAAAVAVVLVTVLVWWLLSGNGPQGPAGNDDRLAVRDVDATGQVVPPDGGGTNGDPGSSEPGPGRDEVPPGGDPGPVMSNPNGVPITSFRTLGPGDRLLLTYTTGVPECYGELDTPEVIESDGSVTVTLSLVPPDRPAEMCIDLAVVEQVRVDLDVPLGDRSLLDGSYAQRVRVEPDRAAGG